MVLNSHDVPRSYQPARITIGVILGVMAYILLTLAPETLSPRSISQPLTSTPFILPLTTILVLSLDHLEACG